MEDHDRYDVAANVIHEVLDGEVIIANLEGGMYYSLGGVGVDVWGGLVGGAPVDRIVSELATACAADESLVAAEVRRLVDELRAEELITPRGGADESAPAISITTMAFETPVLEKYADMQQLLLLDPIHDVGDSGWPAAREDV